MVTACSPNPSSPTERHAGRTPRRQPNRKPHHAQRGGATKQGTLLINFTTPKGSVEYTVGAMNFVTVK